MIWMCGEDRMKRKQEGDSKTSQWTPEIIQARVQPASNLEQSSDRASKKNLMDSSGSLKKVPWDLTLTPARTDSNLNPFLMKSAFWF